MYLIEHCIEEIIKETKQKTQWGTDIVEVEMIVNCYGVTEKTTHLFKPFEWEKAKKDGYYLA